MYFVQIHTSDLNFVDRQNVSMFPYQTCFYSSATKVDLNLNPKLKP